MEGGDNGVGMIIRRTGDGSLLLITQPDHARLAGALISAWDALPVPAAWRAAVLYAIEQHDTGWHEVDACPIWNADTRAPHDFTDTPAEVRWEIWPRGVARVAADSSLAAALVARHGLTLHAERRNDAAWRSFFSQLDALQAEMQRRCAAETGIDRDALDRGYELLHVGDVASLVFCNRWKGPIDAKGYRITLGEEDTVLVSPDPFRGARIRFELAARAIPDRPYLSAGDLRAAFAQSRAITLQGAAAGLATSP